MRCWWPSFKRCKPATIPMTPVDGREALAWLSIRGAIASQLPEGATVPATGSDILAGVLFQSVLGQRQPWGQA
jgi:hypothetical protein